MKHWIAICMLGLAIGCAPTDVKTTSEYAGMLPKPAEILVYDLAVSPDEVQMDKGVGSMIAESISKTPRTAEEKAIGNKVADSLTDKLVAELQKQNLAFVVRRAEGPPPPGAQVLMIKGHFLSIDEGNRTERVVVGLGMGRTSVKASVQVFETLPNKPTVLVEQFVGDAKSGFKPGMAETVGAGAAVGTVGTAVAVSGAMAVGSEAFGANVEADTQRMAENLVKRIKELYAAKGWTS
jgi:hypothetical protein